MDIVEALRAGVASVTLKDLVDWRRGKGEGRLRLPPIQRSLVWRNEQIVNYWDSLLRGYPAGMFLVHGVDAGSDRRHSGLEQGSDAEGRLSDVKAGDWQLFDGQQRMSALLLGFGEGQLKDSLRLWIDFGDEPTDGSDLKFALRISSAGQPFGYRREAPNSKVELGKRANRWEAFGDAVDREKVFSGKDVTLIDAKAAVPLPEVLSALDSGWHPFRERAMRAAKTHAEAAAGKIEREREEEAKARISSEVAALEPVIDAMGEEVFNALRGVLDRKAIVADLPAKLVSDPDEYTRFFGRIGQGGTALTNDELTYSIMKQKFPHIRDRMSEIRDMRFASEVDLVLATLRVARLRVERVSTAEEMIPRPTPAYVKGLRGSGVLPDPDTGKSPNDREKNLEMVRAEFLRLIPEKGDAFPIGQDLERICELLEGEDGLPRMLIARLPREAVDMLLLLVEVTRGDDPGELMRVLRGFTLYCLFATWNADKCADVLFRHASGSGWSALDGGLHAWRDFVQNEGIASVLPGDEQFKAWREELEDAETLSVLPTYDGRLTSCDDSAKSASDWMRQATTNRERVKRMLMWAQRAYLKTAAGGFDPLSARDEDLPLDLDHVVPASDFGGYWRDGLVFDLTEEEEKSFRYHRRLIGDSLGNFRWLCARANRRRKDGPLETSDSLTVDHLFDDETAWRALVGETSLPWDRARISEFRRKVELRSLKVLEKCVESAQF